MGRDGVNRKSFGISRVTSYYGYRHNHHGSSHILDRYNSFRGPLGRDYGGRWIGHVLYGPSSLVPPGLTVVLLGRLCLSCSFLHRLGLLRRILVNFHKRLII
jgi:hypothetical protein